MSMPCGMLVCFPQCLQGVLTIFLLCHYTICCSNTVHLQPHNDSNHKLCLDLIPTLSPVNNSLTNATTVDSNCLYSITPSISISWPPFSNIPCIACFCVCIGMHQAHVLNLVMHINFKHNVPKNWSLELKWSFYIVCYGCVSSPRCVSGMLISNVQCSPDGCLDGKLWSPLIFDLWWV